MKKTKRDGHISSVINSEEYVEHDAFIIFRKMMSVCEKWYLTSDPSRVTSFFFFSFFFYFFFKFISFY